MLRLLLVCVFCLFLASSSVSADPIVVIGEGHDVTSNGNFVFHLQNSDASLLIDLHTSFTSNPIGRHEAALPGQPLNLNFDGAGVDNTGTLTIGGITYPALGSSIIIVTGAVAPLDISLNEDFHVFAPFIFNGDYTGFDSPDFFTAHPLVNVTVFGTGIVDATVRNFGSGYYTVTHVTYTLSTPEPASVILFTTGLLGAMGVLRRTKNLRT